MTRLLLFLGLLVLSFLLPVWLALLLMAIYAFRYTAYEVLVLGALLDLESGLSFPILYTALSALLLLVVETVKPRIRRM